VTLTAGSSAVGDWRLTKTTLYSTIEPCLMCAGALLLSRVGKLVYGAPDVRHGAHGSLTDLFSLPHPTHSIEIVSGIYRESAGALLREFFQRRR